MRRLIILLGLILFVGGCSTLTGLRKKSTPMTTTEKKEVIQEEWQKALEPTKDYEKYQKKQRLVKERRLERQRRLVRGIKTEAKPFLSKINKVKTLAPDKFQKTITLKAGNVPLKNILEEISRMAGVETIIERDVDTTQPATANVENLPVATALRMILSPLGYSFETQGNRLRVYAFDTKIFRVVLPPIKQNYESVVSNKSVSTTTETTGTTTTEEKGTRLGAKITVSSKIEDSSLWKELEDNIKNMISDKGKYSVNTVAGLITVSDYGFALEKIGKYIDEINTELSRQIFVKVKIVEVNLKKEFAFGIDWNVIKDKFIFTSDFAVSNITGAMAVLTPRTGEGAGVTTDGVSATIDALETQGDIKIVSQPQTMLLNNQPAIIQVGNIQAYVSSVSSETTEWGTTYSVETSDIQEGVILSLCARIMEDGNIYMNISPVVTNLQQLRQITFGETTVEAPETTSRAMNTSVKIHSGDTVIIGGLISQRQDKETQGVPFLSRIPILGYFFKSKQNASEKTEIVIFITPEIIG